MRTAVVSDLHLGSNACILDTPPARDRLLTELESVDQVILLGDILSFRTAPEPAVMRRAEPVLRALGQCLADRRVTLVPGNHDHHLTQLLSQPRPKREANALATRLAVEPCDPWPLGRIAEWMPGCELELAYPGIWVREDVYATHGHYLDCHITVPRTESILATAVQELDTRLPPDPAPGDYEAVLAPIYAFAHARAQIADTRRHPPRSLVARALGRLRREGWKHLLDEHSGRGVVPLLAAAGLRGAARTGLTPFRSKDLSPAGIGRAGVEAMIKVLDGFSIQASNVIFGHTHRAGPLPEEPEWVTTRGIRLVNTGSWVYEPSMIRTGGASDPYWPGTIVVLDDRSEPQIHPLLDDRSLAAPA